MFKKLLILGVAVLFTHPLSSGEKVQFSTIQKTALANAKALWGQVYPDEPIVYYDLNDEVCAYMYNFRKNEPFPSANLESLFKDKNLDQDEFGYILVNAGLYDDPVEAYGNGISEGRLWRNQIIEMAQKTLNTKDVKLERSYLIDPASKWYKFSSNEAKIYIKKIPPAKIYSTREFELQIVKPWREKVRKLNKKVNRETSLKLWSEYASGKGITASSWYHNYIPHYEEVPYYDWYRGCTPTSAAMCLGYYDRMSMQEGNPYYGLFVSHYFTARDKVQNEMDLQIPDIIPLLASKMHTKSNGKTYPHNMPGGIEEACTAKGHGCDADGDGPCFDLNYARTSIVNQIKKGRPCMMNTYGHTVCVVGYKRRETDWGTAKYKFFIHDTWDNQLHTWNFKEFYSMIKLDVKHPGIGDIKLITPYSDPRYNARGLGDELWIGRANSIEWETTNPQYGAVDIIYRSPDDTLLIADHTENDGLYIWDPPDSMAATQEARIDLIWYDLSDDVIAADGTQSEFSMVHSYLSGIYYRRKTSKEFPALYKVKIPDTHPWAVLGFGSGPEISYNKLGLYLSTAFEYQQIEHYIPMSEEPEYKNNVLILHPRSIGFPDDQWLGVKAELQTVEESVRHTVEKQVADETCGLGDNEILWESDQIVDVYNLVIDLPDISSEDTIKLTLSPLEDTNLDLGFALFTGVTTYKYDTLGTARDLNWYADDNGWGQGESLTLDSKNYSTLFARLSEDTCGLVLFAKRPVNQYVDLNFNISSSKFPSHYKNIGCDTSLLIAKNPSRISFDSSLVQNQQAKLGALAVRGNRTSGWNLQAINMNVRYINDFFFMFFDTLTVCQYPYPNTNFCLFDFSHLEQLPYCMTNRLRGAGNGVAQFDLSHRSLTAKGVTGNWNSEELIKIWELDTEDELNPKKEYSYTIELDERGSPTLTNLSLAVIPLAATADTSDTTVHVCSRQDMNAYPPAYDRLTGNQTIEFTDRPGRYAVVLWSDQPLATSYELSLNIEEKTAVRTNDKVPLSFHLGQNYPNPFNSSTIIEYSLARKSKVEISIYDVKGKLVKTLVNAHKSAGRHQACWEASASPTGIYFYKISTGNISRVKKCILIK